MKRESGARQRQVKRESPLVVAKRRAAKKARMARASEAVHRRDVRWAERVARPKLTAAERHRLKYRTDPGFVINMRMRTAIKKALRAGKAGRRWESLVGYSLADLVKRLTDTLPDGYSVRDFCGGGLHIDHIVPRCTFDVTDQDELRQCWALTNLQSLTAVENLKKGRRVDG